MYSFKDGFDDHNIPSHIIWTVCLDDCVWFLLETRGESMDKDKKEEKEGKTGKDSDKPMD